MMERHCGRRVVYFFWLCVTVILIHHRGACNVDACNTGCIGCETCQDCDAWSGCFWQGDDVIGPKCQPASSGISCTYDHVTECDSTPDTSQYRSENSALSSIAAAMGGTRWFDPLVNHCLLPPIFCNDGCSGSIYRVLLHNYSLSGTVPDEIVVLSDVKYLYFNQNRISGTTALNFADYLTNLEYNNWNSNQMSGTLPESATADRISYLGFKYNRMSGTLPASIFQLTTLTHLVYSHMEISGSLPGEVGSLTALLELQSGDLNLSGTVPATLSALEELQDLSLGSDEWIGKFNHISGTVPEAQWSHMSFLRLDFNRISGTMARDLSTLDRLESMFVTSNPMSGTLPSRWGGSLKNLFAMDNRISGTIETMETTNLDQIATLAFIGNNISGTMTVEHFGNMPNLHSLLINQNVGLTMDLELVNVWPMIQYVFVQDNGMKHGLPKTIENSSIRGLMCHGNDLSGTISNLPDSIRYFSASGNTRVSGTVPTGMHRAETVLLNNMRISGTIPHMKDLKDPRNDPDDPDNEYKSSFGDGSRRQNTDRNFGDEDQIRITTLALARNYVKGPVNPLRRWTSLENLLLSGNYFSCETPRTRGAPEHGVVFLLPVAACLIEIGGAMVENFVLRYNMFTYYRNVSTEDSLTLIYAGNFGLQSAGHWVEPSAVDKADYIKQGTVSMMPGDSDFKVFMFISLPLQLIFFAGCFYLSTRDENSTTLGERLRSYFVFSVSAGIDTERSILMRELRHAWRPAYRMAAIALVTIILNLIYTSRVSIYEGYGCTSTTLAGSTALEIDADMSYQWLWVVLTLATSSNWLCYLYDLRVDYRSQNQKGVWKCFQIFSLSLDPRYCVLEQWQINYRSSESASDRCNADALNSKELGHLRESKKRHMFKKFLAFIFGLLAMFFVSIPAFAYVTSQNIPKNSGLTKLLVYLLGSGIVYAGMEIILSLQVIPRMAGRISSLRFGHVRTVDLIKSQSSIMLYIETAMVIAPAIAVFLMDESCLRYYLFFAEELAELFQIWGRMDLRGAAAYRTNTCSRALMRSFLYVWLNVFLLQVLVIPGVELLKSHASTRKLVNNPIQFLRSSLHADNNSQPATAKQQEGTSDCAAKNQDEVANVSFSDADLDKIEEHAEEGEEEEDTQNSVHQVQVSLITTLKLCMMAFSFGNIIPLLALLIPAQVWSQIAAHRWANMNSEASTGQMIAAHVLVAHPKLTFEFLSTTMSILISLMFMIDMQFSIGPIIFLVIGWSISLCVFLYLSRIRAAQEAKEKTRRANCACCEEAASEPVTIEMNPTGPVTIEMNPAKLDQDPTLKEPVTVDPQPTRFRSRDPTGFIKSIRLKEDNRSAAAAFSPRQRKMSQRKRAEAPPRRQRQQPQKQDYARAVKMHKIQLEKGMISQEQFSALRRQEVKRYKQDTREYKLQSWRHQKEVGLISAERFEKLERDLAMDSTLQELSSDDEENQDVSSQMGEAAFNDYGHNARAPRVVNV